MPTKSACKVSLSFVLIVAMFVSLLPGAVQKVHANVSPGDIAIIGFQADSPDKLAFVVLNQIAAGETIRFTDSGWYSSGSFRANEGGIEFTASTNLTPGTVISRANPFTSGDWNTNNSGLGSGGFSLSASGDQIIAFQGDASSPNMIFAVQAGADWSEATSSNTSAVPAGLVDGTTAAYIGSDDNAYYNGPTSGTPAELLAAIGNSSNWTGSGSVQTWPAWSFSVGGSIPGPEIVDVWLSDTAFDDGDPATVSVELYEAPEAGSPATISVSSPAFSSSPVNIIISNPNYTGTANVTMVGDGSYTATATAAGGCTGSSISSTFTVTGGASPVAPVAYAGADRTVNLDGANVTEYLAAATAQDANGLSGVTYSWTPASASGISGWTNRTGNVTSSSSPASAQVTLNQEGTYTFTLTVTDPDSLYDTDSVTITVVDISTTDEYDPPANYYNPARPGGSWYTGSTLQNALHGIIDNHVYRSYDSVKEAAGILDQDPNNPNNIILIYNGASVDGDWGGPWNREHMWPDSRNSNPNDLFNIRPCNVSINSSRGNDPYGEDSGEWDANQGAPHRGDSARIMFYMETRYTNLTLVHGDPGSTGNNQMGDLTDLLNWHYEDPVSERERRMNHLMYSQQDNPTRYQGNRNPFIDHPELVWTIWGGHANNSMIYVGSSAPADGTSTQTIDLGPVIRGGTLGSPQSVTIRKTGSDPTTFDMIADGDVICSSVAPRQTFVGGNGNRNITVSLSASTATCGHKSGTIYIDNTDLTSAAIGRGSADGDDTISVVADVLEHSNASFNDNSDQNTLVIDFGEIPRNSGVEYNLFELYNLESVAGFTAGLDLDSISSSGDTSILGTTLSTFTNLQAGEPTEADATFNTNTLPGAYQATYTLHVSDQNISGAQSGTSLVLTIRGEVTPVPIFPFDNDGDDDIDLDDLQSFLNCLNSPGTAISPDCEVHDSNIDGDVDLSDFAAFQIAFTG